jgi:hypothetical protein
MVDGGTHLQSYLLRRQRQEDSMFKTSKAQLATSYLKTKTQAGHLKPVILAV